MRQRILSVLLVGTALGATGCQWATAKSDAESVARAAFTARKAGVGESALRFYHDAFFTETPREDWVRMLASWHAKVGAPTEQQLKHWSVSVINGPAGVGAYVKLAYRVDYADGIGTETLTLHAGADGGEPQIVHHLVSSPALLE